MARWTVEDGEQQLVIESEKGLISLGSPDGAVFTSGPDVMRDVRSKLGLAIADAQGLR